MAYSVNKVILLGNLGRDPEVRYTQSGTAVANFSVATSERRGRGDQAQERTEWHNIVAWDKLAQLCERLLRKGSKVYVEGRLQTRPFDPARAASRAPQAAPADDVDRHEVTPLLVKDELVVFEGAFDHFGALAPVEALARFVEGGHGSAWSVRCESRGAISLSARESAVYSGGTAGASARLTGKRSSGNLRSATRLVMVKRPER